MTSDENACGGRPKRACDSCARLKSKCDARSPCYTCASRGMACSYQGRMCQRNETLQQATPDEQSTSSCGDESSSPKEVQVLEASAQPPTPFDMSIARATENSPTGQATRLHDDSQLDMHQTRFMEEEHLANVLMWDFDTFLLPTVPPFLFGESSDFLPDQCKSHCAHFDVRLLITYTTS
jgi:hypothetical protein